MVDRIRELLENEQLSPSQFADEIELQRSSLSHVLSGRNKPSLDFVMKIKQRFSEVNLDWLIFGTGDMYLGTKEVIAGDITKPIIEKTKDKNQQLLNFDSQQPDLSIKEKTIDSEKSTLVASQPDVKAGTGKADRVIIFYSNGTFDEYTKG